MLLCSRNFCESNVRGFTAEWVRLGLVIVFAYWILNTYWQESDIAACIVGDAQASCALYCNLAKCWLKMPHCEEVLAQPWICIGKPSLFCHTQTWAHISCDIVTYSIVVWQQITANRITWSHSRSWTGTKGDTEVHRQRWTMNCSHCYSHDSRISFFGKIEKRRFSLQVDWFASFSPRFGSFPLATFSSTPQEFRDSTPSSTFIHFFPTSRIHSSPAQTSVLHPYFHQFCPCKFCVVGSNWRQFCVSCSASTAGRRSRRTQRTTVTWDAHTPRTGPFWPVISAPRTFPPPAS